MVLFSNSTYGYEQGVFMERTQRFNIIGSDPLLTLSMPVDMVNDLCTHSEQNGTNFSVELMLRLSRTLERDSYRDSVHETMAYIFEMN